MKTSLTCLTLFFAAAVALIPEILAQRSPDKKGPTSKIYLAEVKGENRIINQERVYIAKQATAFDAPGTVIETADGAHNVLVFSNGTSMFVGGNAQIKIDRFEQASFKLDQVMPADQPIEPSPSQIDIFLTRGAIGLCPSDMVSGSRMDYNTPHATVSVRGGRLSIEAKEEETIVDVLADNVSVSGKNNSNRSNLNGQALRAGERAIIRPGLPGQPATITITSIPEQFLGVVEERVAIACNARKSVTFDVIQQSGRLNQEIVVRPTIPGDLPTNIVVSPDRFPGT